MTQSLNSRQDNISRNLTTFVRSLDQIRQPFRQLWMGLATGALPVTWCLIIGSTAMLLIYFRLDVAIFRKLRLITIYPPKGWIRIVYIMIAGTCGFSAWALHQTAIYNRFKRHLMESLETSGLKNRLGKIPSLIGDWPLDETTRKLRLRNANLPHSEFLRAKNGLESALKIYVDEIRENREEGTVDVIYAKSPIPSLISWNNDWLDKKSLVIGETRSRLIRSNFSETPHLLVAGQTGGGKSTFLRQIITAQYVKDPLAEFTLIDLKGGLEFQLFQDLPRINVLPDLRSSSIELGKFSSVVKARMSLLRSQKFKDRDSYLTDCRTKRTKPDPVIKSRIIIVIDEAAEMFLAGNQSPARDIQKAREIISQIARQGRAVGVHLIIATQRPDSRSLDPQVKANLTGVLCFQMANDASSMVVIGCGRATDLPSISGRAIWKSGSQMTEVQIPYMSPEMAEELLASFRQADQPAKNSNVLQNGSSEHA